MHLLWYYGTSSKQRQEHNKLATIQIAKLEGTHEYSKHLELVKTLNPNANPKKYE